MLPCVCVTLDNKTRHKGNFFKIELFIINNISIDVRFVRIGYFSEIQLLQNLESEGAKKYKSKYLENHL